VVFLIDPADEYDHPPELFVDRSGDESHGYFALSREWGKGTKPIAQPPDWPAYEQAETAFKQAEKKRLLYVAATRAKHLLVVGYRTTADGIEGAWRELARRATQHLFELADVRPPDVAAAAAVHQFHEAQADLAARFETGRTGSYSVLPITKIAHGNHAELVRAEEGLGKGTSWGRVLHRMFEEMLLNEDVNVELLASNLLKDEERDAAELAEVIRVVTAVQRSPLWQRAKAARERFVEVPFALMVPRADAGLDGDGDTLLHGVIDLVFREGDRWYVVDYKSDSTKGRLPSLIAYYRLQVQHYTRFWSQLTGQPAVGGLFFVDGAVDVWV
jgi:ATP-dependent helicase/nuclease subunit A